VGRIDKSFIGKRFGNLVVLGFDHVDSHRSTCWICECDCGNRIVASRNSLVGGNTRSCGCRKHGPERENLIGKRFGRLTVIDFDHSDTHRNSYWLCECDCGNKSIVTRGGLTSGNTTSCGCYNKDRVRESTTTHGLSRSPLYKAWRDMRSRCENTNATHYHRYGGRGIEVCDEWKNFENFRDWAEVSGYDSKLTIDRINNNGSYSPDNCRWADRHAQGNNRSTNHIIEYNGQAHNIMEWTKILGVNYSTLWGRLKRNDMRDFESYFDRKKEGIIK
jgi:hypothetical protein